MNQLKVNNKDVIVKTYQGQPVVTFKDIEIIQYMMEIIARNNILKELEKDLEDMNDTDMITVADLKYRIERYDNTEDIFGD